MMVVCQMLPVGFCERISGDLQGNTTVPVYCLHFCLPFKHTLFFFSFYFVVLCVSRGGGRLKASVLTNWYPHLHDVSLG